MSHKVGARDQAAYKRAKQLVREAYEQGKAGPDGDGKHWLTGDAEEAYIHVEYLCQIGVCHHNVYWDAFERGMRKKPFVSRPKKAEKELNG